MSTECSDNCSYNDVIMSDLRKRDVTSRCRCAVIRGCANWYHQGSEVRTRNSCPSRRVRARSFLCLYSASPLFPYFYEFSLFFVQGLNLSTKISTFFISNVDFLVYKLMAIYSVINLCQILFYIENFYFLMMILIIFKLK